MKICDFAFTKESAFIDLIKKGTENKQLLDKNKEISKYLQYAHQITISVESLPRKRNVKVDWRQI